MLAFNNTMTAKSNLEDLNFVLGFDENDDMTPFSMQHESSDGDEEYENHSDVIKETEYLLRRRSSSLTIEEQPSNYLPDSKIPANSILGTKHVVDALPIVKDMKPRKSVRFNTDLNEVSEIKQPEFNRDDSVDSNDSFNTKVTSNKLSTGDSSSDDEDAMDKNDVMNNLNKLMNHADVQPSEETKNLLTDVTLLMKQKEKLIRDITGLKIRHEKEMKQLREEYQRRRETYYEELDEVQIEIEEKRKTMTSSKSDEPTNILELTTRQQEYKSQESQLDEMESALAKKREQILEQETELKEYQSFLDRRHKSLTTKEEDLCTLQDELEELSDVLKVQENELKARKESVDDSTTVKSCVHNEDEISKTKKSLNDCRLHEHQLEEELATNKEELKSKNKEIDTYQTEIQKLNTKMKLLESQLSVNLKHHSPTNFEKNTSLKLISRPSKTSLCSPTKSKNYKLKDNNNNLSPQHSIASYKDKSGSSTDSDTPSNSRLNFQHDEGGCTDSYIDGTLPLSPLHKPMFSSTATVTKSSGSALSKTCAIM